MSKKDGALQKRRDGSGGVLYKVFIYVALILLAISVIVPVGWVFLASLKQSSEFSSGSPWALPAGFYFQNFIDAWNKAHMGEYIGNSIIVTAIALVLLVAALPAAYCLSRMEFRGRKILNLCFTAGLFINASYIAVPIFLQLNDADQWVAKMTGGSGGLFLNNLFMLAVVYASTALPFTIYLLSGYFATLPHDYEEAAYSFENSRILHRAILWSAHAEGELHRWFSANLNAEVHAFPANGKFCVVNNTYEPQSTTVWKTAGEGFPLELAANEIRWFEL